MSQPPPSSADDDRTLLSAHIAGDPRAFEMLVLRHKDRLWAVAMQMLGNRDDAADAIQDSLLSAHQHAASFRGDAAVTTWLHRIVVNSCLDRLRKQRPTAPLSNAMQLSGADPYGQVDTRLALMSALANLPDEQRIVLVLVDMEDRPLAEVAQLLGIAEGTVKSRCFRARLAIADQLRQAAGEPAHPTEQSRNLGAAPNVTSTAGTYPHYQSREGWQ